MQYNVYLQYVGIMLIDPPHFHYYANFMSTPFPLTTPTIVRAAQWELSQLCHVTKNNQLIIFTTIYYGLLGGHLRMGALSVLSMLL